VSFAKTASRQTHHKRNAESVPPDVLFLWQRDRDAKVDVPFLFAPGDVATERAELDADVNVDHFVTFTFPVAGS
jgi:hypothetical protein